MGILINITGGSDLTLHEVNLASTAVAEAAHEDANIIFGSVIDEAYRDTIKITVIATGFTPNYSAKRMTNPAPREASQPRGNWQAASAPAVVAPTPVVPVRLGDRDIPTHIRQRWESEYGKSAGHPHAEVPPMPDFDGGILDIPTFLRRQAD
jgi:cell division protein FtsZ